MSGFLGLVVAYYIKVNAVTRVNVDIFYVICYICKILLI